MKIGEIARATGRSAHALRWYERQGLIPGVLRDGGGRRVYSAAHVDWLGFIDRLRLSGMSLRAIKAYAALVEGGRATVETREALLQRHRQAIEAQQQALDDAAAMIDVKIAHYAAWRSSGRRPPWPPAD